MKQANRFNGSTRACQAILCALLLFLASTAGAGLDSANEFMLSRGKTYKVGETLATASYTETHVLLIMVSAYDNGWPPLPGVKKDEAALTETFRQLGYQIHTLSAPDSQITHSRKGIEEGVREFIQRYGQSIDNRLIIFYSGHGETLEVTKGSQGDGTVTARTEREGFLVPAGAPLTGTPSADQAFREQSVPLTFFAEQAREALSKHVLMVFDSCFSGSIFTAMRGSEKLPTDIRALQLAPVRQFYASGSQDQKVPDNSIFRIKFQEGLMGAADLDQDGYIVGVELGLYLRSQVTRDSRGKQTPQFAKMTGLGKEGHILHGGDIVFESPLGRNPAIDKGRSAVGLSERALRSNEPGVFRDCLLCPEMVMVPQTVASVTKSSSGPTLPRDLAVGRFEITVEEWTECFTRGGCSRWLAQEAQSPRHPVGDVSWQDAVEYTRWLTRVTGEVYRLPTKDEWLYVSASRLSSRADAPRYPWGEQMTDNQAACRGCPGRGDGKLVPAGSFAHNRFGLFDVIGNQWEWVTTHPIRLDINLSLSDQLKPFLGQQQTVMGGSWATAVERVGLDAEASYPLNRSLPNFGFRVVKELPSGDG